MMARPTRRAAARVLHGRVDFAEELRGRSDAASLHNDRSSVYNTDMTKQAMQEPTFLILTALADGAQHRYGIMTDVARISRGLVTLRAGTLYAALDRLLGDGIIGVDREEIVGGRLRRYYRLTPAGADLLAAEAARLSTNAEVAAQRLRRLRDSLAPTLTPAPAGGAA
jgi:DNA-binding PadR family transcriptional regulator